MKSKYNILNYGSQILTKVCRPVTFPLNQETQHQIQSLKRCYRNSYVTHKVKTLGLAAPQIGVDKRIFITSKIINNLANFELMRNNMRSFEIYINPRILQYSDESEIIVETCLSFGNDQYEVLRAKTIHIEYYTYNGDIVRKLLKGINSIVCQHQFDHLNGITIADKGKKVLDKRTQQNKELNNNLQVL